MAIFNLSFHLLSLLRTSTIVAVLTLKIVTATNMTTSATADDNHEISIAQKWQPNSVRTFGINSDHNQRKGRNSSKAGTRYSREGRLQWDHPELTEESYSNTKQSKLKWSQTAKRKHILQKTRFKRRFDFI